LPIISIELLNRVSSVIRCLESHNACTFGTASCINVNVCSDHAALLS
jgi:hypothetical protein